MLEAKNVRDVKVQNVAITLDKVLHVIKQTGNYEPPLKTVEGEELFQRLWGQDSVKSSIE